MTPKRKRKRECWPKRVLYLVESFGKLWQVRRNERQIQVCDTRAEAHAYAVLQAKDEWEDGQPTEVRLKNRRNGRFSKDMERTYGLDPYPPRG